MFKKNKDEKNIANLPINDFNRYKWERLYYRPVSFYRVKRNSFYTYSYILIFLSFIFVVFGMITIDVKNKQQKIFNTTVLGKTYEYESTEHRRRVVDDFLKNYNQGK